MHLNGPFLVSRPYPKLCEWLFKRIYHSRGIRLSLALSLGVTGPVFLIWFPPPRTTQQPSVHPFFLIVSQAQQLS